MSENNQCLALAAIANVGGVEFAGNLAAEVSKLLTARSILPAVSVCCLYDLSDEVLMTGMCGLWSAKKQHSAS